MNIDTLRHTGLTQAELGALFGVSRITVCGWMKGRFGPHRLHKEAVEATTAKLTQALQSGKLPLPLGVSKPSRLPAARRAIGLTD